MIGIHFLKPYEFMKRILVICISAPVVILDEILKIISRAKLEREL